MSETKKYLEDVAGILEQAGWKGPAITAPIPEPTREDLERDAAVDYAVVNATAYKQAWIRRAVAAERDNAALRAELALWKPMTPAEAQAAYEAAEAVPMIDEEIDRIVKYATDPANRLTNQEETQLWVRVTKLNAQLAAEKKRADEAEAAAGMMRRAMIRAKACFEHITTVVNEADFVHDANGVIGQLDASLHLSGAGKTFLARLKAAEAVCEAVTKLAGLPNWENRCGEWRDVNHAVTGIVAAWRKERGQ